MADYLAITYSSSRCSVMCHEVTFCVSDRGNYIGQRPYKAGVPCSRCPPDAPYCFNQTLCTPTRQATPSTPRQTVAQATRQSQTPDVLSTNPTKRSSPSSSVGGVTLGSQRSTSGGPSSTSVTTATVSTVTPGRVSTPGRLTVQPFPFTSPPAVSPVCPESSKF